MITGGKGGGHTVTGLMFEERVDLVTLFQNINGYTVEKNKPQFQTNPPAACRNIAM